MYDVCSNEDLPEVELVNLLEEQLPQYKLRVDSLFLYENQDWAQSSQHQPQDASETLSPVLAEETFRYMILGTDRVEQMTKTYNDIDMVTHLLAERDRDLELAARIGQALLKRNHVLSEQNEALEEQLGQAFDQACHIKTETFTYEEKEQQLVNDCVKELRETNAQMSRMTEELSGKSDELMRYQEEISSLLSQIVDLQHKLKEHVIEKEELRLHLQASKDAQRQLTMELHDLQDRNMECLGMLHESQEEIKELRSKCGPAAHLCFSQAYGVFTGESLAAEIEGTMRKKLSLDEESVFKQKAQQKRVFDTVKVANDARGRSVTSPALLPIPGSNRSSVIMTAKPFESGVQQTEDTTLLNQGSSTELPGNSQPTSHPGPTEDSDLATALHRLSLRRQNYLSEKQFFAEEWERKIQVLAEKEEVCSCDTPPGHLDSFCTDQSETTDLGSASCLRGFMPEKLQIVKPLEGSQTLYHWQQLAQPNLGTILDPRPGVITKGFTQTPKDVVYHISDLEEDEEEGITFQVQPPLKVDTQPAPPTPVTGIFLPPITSAGGPVTVATSNPGKCLSCTNSTFTFTTCRILHPSDITQVTPSSGFPSLSCGSSGSSSANTAVNSPAMSYRLSIGESITNRRDSTITFSSTRSLAKLLQERGISAKVYHSPASENPLLQPRPKALATPSTPPNSPSQSPCSSPLPFEPRVHVSENFLASRPAETFLQEIDKAPTGKREESSKLPSTQEVIDVSPGYKLVRNREQISVTLGDEMFNRKKSLESDVLGKIKFPRTDIISDLEDQISELMSMIEQMNRDHQSAQKLLSEEMDLRCAEMKQKFENENRDLRNAHKVELEKLESSYKEALKVEKASAQEKLEEMSKEYKYLKNMFHMYQDSIYDEMEDKWSKRKAEWEKDEKLERERILLQQKHKITKKFELESEEEKRKMNDSFSALFENFTREKEEVMKQHAEANLQIQELRKAKE
ncbi:hypothetical protein STEG23_000695, partial [Scotinomys teguina]